MSKLRALELALDFHRTQSIASAAASANEVLTTAGAFAAFLGEEAAPAKPAKAAKPAKVVESPVIADPEPVVAAEPAKAEKVVVVEVEPAKVTEADIKAVVGQLATNAAAGGAPKAREILDKFGAKNISTLKPENYAAAKKAFDEVLAAAAVAA